MRALSGRNELLDLLAVTVLGGALVRWFGSLRAGEREAVTRHPGLSAVEPELAEELAMWDTWSDEALLNFEENLNSAWPE